MGGQRDLDLARLLRACRGAAGRQRSQHRVVAGRHNVGDRLHDDTQQRVVGRVEAGVVEHRGGGARRRQMGLDGAAQHRVGRPRGRGEPVVGGVGGERGAAEADAGELAGQGDGVTGDVGRPGHEGRRQPRPGGGKCRGTGVGPVGPLLAAHMIS